MEFIITGVDPPANNPRIELEHPRTIPTVLIKSPKSAAFPNVEIVMKSIVFVGVAGLV